MWGKPDRDTQVANRIETVANVTNTVANKRKPKADASGLEAVDAASRRVQKWREANRDRYNERQRELMRRRRAGGSSEIRPVAKGTVE